MINKKLLHNILESLPVSVILGYITNERIYIPFLGFLIVFLIDTAIGSYLAMTERSKNHKPFRSDTFSTMMAHKLLVYFVIIMSMFGMSLVIGQIPEISGYIIPITTALAFYILVYCELLSIQENLKRLGVDIYPLTLLISVGRRVFEAMGIYPPEKEEKKKEDNIKEDH